MDRTERGRPRHPTVVVVDDNPAIVEVVCEALADAGISALGCSQAAEAFWFILRAQPRLILLDIQMPGVNGIELLQQLRADRHAQDLPVLFLTANSHLLTHQLPHYQELGAELLAKPFDIDTLVARVQQLLARAGAQ